jgi:hypothetical protein
MQHDMTLRENPWLSPGSQQSRDQLEAHRLVLAIVLKHGSAAGF